MSKKAEFISLFTELGSSAQVSDNLFHCLEKFVCVLYGSQRLSSVNLLRHKLFVQKIERERKIIDLSLLPPCKENLRIHILRANYVAMMFRQADGLMLQLGSPADHGWDEKGSVRWSEICYPEDISEHKIFNRTYRHVAYRQLARFLYGHLGRHNRRVQPSSAVAAIRRAFPGQSYAGFQYY